MSLYAKGKQSITTVLRDKIVPYKMYDNVTLKIPIRRVTEYRLILCRNVILRYHKLTINKI